MLECQFQMIFLICIGHDDRKGDKDDSDSDLSDIDIGAQEAPLTQQISSILRRYPERGQILKVSYSHLAISIIINSLSLCSEAWKV